jgi:hypothetical protein
MTSETGPSGSGLGHADRRGTDRGFSVSRSIRNRSIVVPNKECDKPDSMYSIVLGARLRSYSFIFSNIILFSFIRVYDLTFTFF